MTGLTVIDGERGYRLLRNRKRALRALLVLSPLLARERLVFPAELEKVPEATEMTPSMVLLASGVKVAV